MFPGRLEDSFGIASATYSQLDKEMVEIKQSALAKEAFSLIVDLNKRCYSVYFVREMHRRLATS